MQKIVKDIESILSEKFREWHKKIEYEKHPLTRTYYDDIVMVLYKCQKGVCAYTERFICPPELYNEGNWQNGRYKVQNPLEYSRVDHAGELEHYDPSLKKEKYWLWSNLFMIDSTINARKWDKPVVNYLKPDQFDYEPENYLEYDEETHRFVPHTDLSEEQRSEIQNMINNVLFLNHGVIIKERREYIQDIRFKLSHSLDFSIDRYFTVVKLCLEIN